MAEYSADKRGYLHEDFRLFHLRDHSTPRLADHYHEFDKLLFFRSGRVSYVVEGVTYFLKPWDILLIRHGLIHRAVIDPAEPYERVVVWLGREYLERRSEPQTDLASCFTLTGQRNFHLLRTDAKQRLTYMQLLQQMEEAVQTSGFGSRLLADALCQQLLIAVNRDLMKDRTAEQRDSYRVDPKLEAVLHYIMEHLTEELDVDTLAGHFYLSRYYLMHRFKAATGYTVHQYITQKRLLLAGELLRSGVPVMKAAEGSGFREYSTFLRAFQRTFHSSPREFTGGREQERGFHGNEAID